MSKMLHCGGPTFDLFVWRMRTRKSPISGDFWYKGVGGEENNRNENAGCSTSSTFSSELQFRRCFFPSPPWRQLRGKSLVNLPQMLPPGGSI